MKKKVRFYTLGLALSLATFSVACESTRTETNTDMASDVDTDRSKVGQEISETASAVNQDLDQFTSWVNDKAGKAENLTEEQWKELKADYKRQEAQLDAKSDTWDEKAKREWKDVKSFWKRTEDKVESKWKNR